MAAKKTSSAWKCATALVRLEGGAQVRLTAGPAAKYLGVRTRYLAGATWRPGGKRKRKHV